ncbi:MAG: hypothetical protein K6B72_06495 [Lachnospiraceae bacterium]|nr:hypothetical protein [Lachnospiraceae bacterium]
MNENSSILNTQNTTITLEEARKSVYQMNLIDDFLLTCLLTDEESGKEAARIILSALLNRNIRVVDVTSQKVFNGIHKDMRGIRLDAYIHAAEEDHTENADIYNIEAETRYADKRILPQRSRYYSSLIDVHHLKTGTVFDNLPKLVIIMILSYDPFDAGDLYYEASTKLITHPKIPYDDGIRRLYFYTDGNCNIPEAEGGSRISDMIRYIQNSHEESVINPDIRDLDNIVSRVRQREEVSIKYMQSWEREAILVKETTERVRAEVTDNDAHIYVRGMRKRGASDAEIAQDLVEEFGLSDEKAHQLLEEPAAPVH